MWPFGSKKQKEQKRRREEAARKLVAERQPASPRIFGGFSSSRSVSASSHAAPNSRTTVDDPINNPLHPLNPFSLVNPYGFYGGLARDEEPRHCHAPSHHSSHSHDSGSSYSSSDSGSSWSSSCDSSSSSSSYDSSSSSSSSSDW